MKEIYLRNQQRACRLHSALLRSITTALLEDLVGFSDYQLAVHLVSARKMAEMNQLYLRHDGPTDVITFDLRSGFDLPHASRLQLAGEIYICVSEAERQAKEFGTSWPEELARYVTHGILHLAGFDDVAPGQRRRMKREENRLMRALAERFNLADLAR